MITTVGFPAYCCKKPISDKVVLFFCVGMNCNLPIVGNSCFCFSLTKNTTISDDENEENDKVGKARGDMVIKKAVVTKEVVETAIRSTSHLGEAIENGSMGLCDRISHGKFKETKAQEGREKNLADLEDKVFKEIMPKKPLISSPERLEVSDRIMERLDPLEPLKKKKSHWWKISKKTPKKSKKIPERDLIDLSPTPKVYPRTYKREDNRHLWER